MEKKAMQAKIFSIILNFEKLLNETNTKSWLKIKALPLVKASKGINEIRIANS
jgi:hypothetical protein